MNNSLITRVTSRLCLVVLGLLHAAQIYAAPRVVINEIFPSPKEPKAEFIELINTEAVAVDLHGWNLKGGIEFTFPQIELPPNTYLLVAANPSFLKEYFRISSTQICGPYTEKLKVSREQIILVDNFGTSVDEVDYKQGFPWPTGANISEGSIELINPDLDNSLGGAWRIVNTNQASSSELIPVFATPGRQNSVYSPQALPIVRQVQHTPTHVTSGIQVRISTEISNPDQVAEVILFYQVVAPGNYIRKEDPIYNKQWIKITMLEENSLLNPTSGFSTFSALIPPSVQKHRHLIRYRIAITNRSSYSVNVPYPDDEQSNFAYFCYDGVPGWKGSAHPGIVPEEEFSAELMAKSLPVYHLIADPGEVEACKYTFNSFTGTFVYDDVVYDHIHYRFRGGSSFLSGKYKWKIHFNKGRYFSAQDNYGKSYPRQIPELNINACATPRVPINRGMAGLGDALAYRLFQLAGVPASDTHWFHFRLITNAEESSPTDQYAGDLMGLYLYEEDIDSDFLKTKNYPDGNIFEISFGGDLPNANLKSHSPGQPSDCSDWAEFATSSKLQQTENWWRGNLDLQTYFNFRAINRLVTNFDIREDNNFLFYKDPNGLWYPIPRDLDSAYLPILVHSGTLYQKACLDHLAIRREYKNRCRELLDLLCSDTREYGGQACQLIKELGNLINPPTQPLSFVDVDQALWNYNPNANSYHRGKYYINPGYYDNVVRTLVSSDFEGFQEYIKDFITNTDSDLWAPNDGDQWGYGYNSLAFEASDVNTPSTPKMIYVGEQGFPIDGLAFRCVGFLQYTPDMQNQITHLKWRVGKISNPLTPLFEPSKPWEYEITPVWQSETVLPNSGKINLPSDIFKIGHTYRARVKVKNVLGVWSHWSAPIEFLAGHSTTNTPIHDVVRINEWMADNRQTIQDPCDDDYDDWLELYNPSESAVNLKDYRISDQADFKNAWSIPYNVSLEAGQCMLVWADNETQQNQPGFPLHLPFRLSASSESFYLWTPDGKLMDAVHFGPAEPDSSEGRYPDGSDHIQKLSASSPGNVNYNYYSGAIYIIPEYSFIDSDKIELRWSSIPGLRYVIETIDKPSLQHWRFFHDYGMATEEESIFSFTTNPESEACYLVKEISDFPRLNMYPIPDQKKISLTWDASIGGLYQLEILDNIKTGKWQPFLSRRTALSELETIHIMFDKKDMQFFRVFRLR